MIRYRLGYKYRNERKKKRQQQQKSNVDVTKTRSFRRKKTSRQTAALLRKIAPKPTTSSQPEATSLDLSSLPPKRGPRHKPFTHPEATPPAAAATAVTQEVVTSSHDVTTSRDVPAIPHDTPLILRRSLPRRAREARRYNEDGDEDFEEQERQSEDEEMRIEFVEPPPQEEPPEEDVPQEEPLQEEMKPSAVEASPEEEGSGNLVIADDPLAML